MSTTKHDNFNKDHLFLKLGLEYSVCISIIISIKLYAAGKKRAPNHTKKGGKKKQKKRFIWIFLSVHLMPNLSVLSVMCDPIILTLNNRLLVRDLSAFGCYATGHN